MSADVELLKTIAKAFRKSKRWYLGYVTSQICILGFAVVALFAAVMTTLSIRVFTRAAVH